MDEQQPTETHVQKMEALLTTAIDLYELQGVHDAATLLPWMSAEEYLGLKNDADKYGFLEPVTITSDRHVLDGRNRLCASLELEKDVRLEIRDCENPLVFVLSKNLHHRHLTVGQRAVLALDVKVAFEAEAKKKSKANLTPGNPKSIEVIDLSPRKGSGKEEEKSVSRAAKTTQVSRASVQRAQVVKDIAPDLLQAVKQGEMAIDAAHKEAKKRQAEMKAKDPTPLGPSEVVAGSKIIFLETHIVGETVEYSLPKSKPTFNRTNDAVEWAGWTWNPVTGCLHGCRYCYAREIALSASMHAAYPIGFDPLFHHERLDAPSNTKIPQEVRDDPKLGRVFVCSMADLFGKWVPQHWIDQVMQATLKVPEWEYLFLTKFPQRLVDLTLPKSAWIGATIDMPSRINHTLDALRAIPQVRVRWLSLEPLLQPLMLDLRGIDWLVIGAQSATQQPDGPHPSFAPPIEWVMSLIEQAKDVGTAVYLKSNLLGRTDSQFPGMKLLQELPVLKTESSCI